MKKISDFNLFDEIINEYESEKNASIEKEALNITPTPGAFVGALTGALIAKKKMETELMRQQIENKSLNPLTGNFYTQVQNLYNNLKVVFTPLGVLYIIKHGPKEITIDNINTDEMNTEMYEAWQNKNYEYFRNLLLNKIHSEIQLAEQLFAKQFIEKHMQLKNKLSKQASEVINAEDLTFIEMLNEIKNIKTLYSKHNDVTEKLAEIMYHQFENLEIKIPLQLDRPLDKYAGLGSKLNFLGLNLGADEIDSLQREFLNPDFLTKHVQIGYLPDRVLFIVQDKVITSLPVINMNQEGFENFEKQNSKFFRELFAQEIKKGIARMKSKLPQTNTINNSAITKTAKTQEKFDITDIFLSAKYHPVIYSIVLQDMYGHDWYNFDNMALVKIIEQDFNLQEPIHDAALNKILSIKIANISPRAFASPLAFEKIIRSFNNLPIDFLTEEIDDLGLNELAFGVEVLNRITPYDDIYDNFSDEVFEKMVKILLNAHHRLFAPSALTITPLLNSFITLLNLSLLNAYNLRDIKDVNSQTEINKIRKNNEYIFNSAYEALNTLRELLISHPEIQKHDINLLIDKILDEQNISKNRDLIAKQVLDNYFADKFLIQQDQLLKEQLKQLDIKI